MIKMIKLIYLLTFFCSNRLLTLNAYCRFMSVAAKLDHLNEPQNEVKINDFLNF